MTAQPRRALGKGLSALIPGAEGEDKVEKIPTSEIEVARIKPRPDQPRSRFDPEALQELAQSVKAQGVLVPLLVTPDPDGGEHFVLVAGERRLRAAKIAGLVTVPCRIIEGLDHRAIHEISLVENLQREDLNPVELAEGYRRLIDELGYTQQQVAERVGKDRVTVANSLRLLALPEPVRRMLVEGELSAGHARALLMIEGEGDKLALAHRIVKGGLTVRDIERIAKGQRAKKPAKEPDPEQRRSELAAREVARDLESSIGQPVSIAHKGNGGRLVIRYKNLDELDRIVNLLKTGSDSA